MHTYLIASFLNLLSEYARAKARTVAVLVFILRGRAAIADARQRYCAAIAYLVLVKRTFDRILYFNILLALFLALRICADGRAGRSSHGKPPGSHFVRSLPVTVRNLFPRLCS